MRRLLFTLLTITTTTILPAAGSVNLDSLYRVLDAAIDSSEYYVKQKNNMLNDLKTDYLHAANAEEKYEYAKKLATEYVAYVNDSAIAYHYECIHLAEEMGNKELEMKSRLGLAYQLANSGFYNEARIHFQEIPEEYLKDNMLMSYYSGMNHLYGEMGYYSHDPVLKKQFHAESDRIRDLLMERMDTTSSSYVALRSMVLNNKQRPEEALVYSDKWKATTVPGTRRYAIMAFFRSEIYKKLGDTEMQRYWLVQAALIDVRNAIMDQGALWSLANAILRNEDDLDRAYKYMDFSWTCISQFSTHMRAWNVAPILTVIDTQYRDQLRTANTKLRWMIAASVLLMLALLGSLIYVSRKRQELSRARKDLKKNNEQLAQLNNQLNEINQELSASNIKLQDSNRVKDEYITKFLQLCSEYIDKLDDYRIKINRKVRANQFADIQKMTSSNQMKEDELKNLFDNFDAVFLHLFPNFVNDFNALLRPDCQIAVPDEKHLTTDLRIFALIRLGIDESSRIAEFLRYSPNSIYNYRARTKNKATGDREMFEKRVKEIGMNG